MTGQEIIDFIDENIPFNEKGEPWRLSAHQRQVLKVFYAKDYWIRLWSETKKSGKSFIGGVMADVEAIMVPYTQVGIFANDEEQAKSRVFETAKALCEHNPKLRECVSQFLTNEMRFTNGSVVRAFASDYKGASGSRARVVMFDELWAYSLEKMQRLFEEAQPAVTEKGAYTLVTSYAGFENESPILQGLYQRAMKGKRVHKTLELYRDQGLICFWSHKGRQPWQTGEAGRRKLEELRRSLRPGTFARQYRNEWVSSESAFVTSEQWDAIVNPSLTPSLSGETLFLGVDIGVKSDNAAGVGVRWHEDGKRLVIATHKLWKPTRSEPVNLQLVQDYLNELWRRHHVQVALFDPSQALQMIQNLRREWGDTDGNVVQEFAQHQANGVLMGESLFSLVKDRNLVAYPSEELKRHVTNAVGVETPRGVRMVKATGSRKIDAGIALAMACVAAIRAGADAGSVDDVRVGGNTLPLPDWSTPRTGSGYSSADGDAFDAYVESVSGGGGNGRDWDW